MFIYERTTAQPTTRSTNTMGIAVSLVSLLVETVESSVLVLSVVDVFAVAVVELVRAAVDTVVVLVLVLVVAVWEAIEVVLGFRAIHCADQSSGRMARNCDTSSSSGHSDVLHRPPTRA